MNRVDPSSQSEDTTDGGGCGDGGLDSDDETLRFDKEDDLYDGEADEEDAKWVAQQVRGRHHEVGQAFIVDFRKIPLSRRLEMRSQSTAVCR